MSIFQRMGEAIKNRVSEIQRENAERKAFKKLVDKETLPLRRKGYLMEKIKLAVDEGKLIAQQELAKKQASAEAQKLAAKSKPSDFGIPDMDDFMNPNRNKKEVKK